jgi:nucleoside-diphosphate-sugar epimerase
MKILFTGATGQAFRPAAEALAVDHEVWAAARFSSADIRAELEEKGIKTFEWKMGETSVAGLPDDFTHVLHAAPYRGQPDPSTAAQANAVGAGQLMYHCRRAKAFLFISTFAVHAKPATSETPLTEEAMLGGYAPYAPTYPVGKLAAEGAVRAFASVLDLPTTIAHYIAPLADDADVTVIVPGPARMGRFERLRRGRTGARLARALASDPHVRVTLVRDHLESHPTIDGRGGIRMLPRASHRVVVLVDRPDRAALQAVRYALSLGAEEVVAVHAAVDPEVQDELISRWMELRMPIALELVECWDRDVARSVERYVVDLMGPRNEVTVVLPRRDYAKTTQRLLHDRTSRSIARTLGRYEHVDVAVVPYYFGRDRRVPPSPDGPPASVDAAADQAR